jgi:hypothetical protein
MLFLFRVNSIFPSLYKWTTFEWCQFRDVTMCFLQDYLTKLKIPKEAFLLLASRASWTICTLVESVSILTSSFCLFCCHTIFFACNAIVLNLYQTSLHSQTQVAVRVYCL